MSTMTVAPRPAAASRFAAASSGVANALSDTASIAWRNLLTLLRTPQALVFATIQPVIFVLLFRYAFGGAIHVPGTNYVDFLMPGIFAQTVAFGAVGTAVGLSGDVRTGILVRFRTLPMARIAVLGGRTVADLARNLLVVAIMTGVGFAVGFRSQQGAGGLLWTNHKYPAYGGVPICTTACTTTTSYGDNGPNDDTSVWNFTPQFGVGAHYFLNAHRSVDLGANAIHISSASLGDRNPGINASVQFTLGYSWWK